MDSELDNEFFSSKILRIGQSLSNRDESLPIRFMTLCTLRDAGGKEAIQCICRCFSDPSALLKSKLAYCLGQMRDERALPYLVKVLKDTSQEPMVRHEAGKAIGAIGSPTSLDILNEYSKDPVEEVAETCQLASQRIAALNSSKEDSCISPYDSVDPTPSFESGDIDQLKKTLLDENETPFNRYKAIFSLRNIKSDEAVKVLCQGLSVGSALFRLEAAFVLGQLQSPLSVGSLEQVLRRGSAENANVRHEATEALDSIPSPNFSTALMDLALIDHELIDSQTWQVTLDLAGYENSEKFHVDAISGS